MRAPPSSLVDISVKWLRWGVMPLSSRVLGGRMGVMPSSSRVIGGRMIASPALLVNISVKLL